jgi:hypothetical protein
VREGLYVNLRAGGALENAELGTIEPIEAAHVARGIDAVKKHGGHGTSLDMVL